MIMLNRLGRRPSEEVMAKSKIGIIVSRTRAVGLVTLSAALNFMHDASEAAYRMANGKAL